MLVTGGRHASICALACPVTIGTGPLTPRTIEAVRSEEIESNQSES